MMGMIGGGGQKREGRRSILWTKTKSIKDTEATQLLVVENWRENMKSTQLLGYVRWMGKKYSYWLSCAHITQNISTILH
jgi:hypothetical protein